MPDDPDLTLWSIAITAEVTAEGETNLRYELDGEATVFELLVAIEQIAHTLREQLNENYTEDEEA